jgi:hypothetical protein
MLPALAVGFNPLRLAFQTIIAALGYRFAQERSFVPTKCFTTGDANKTSLGKDISFHKMQHRSCDPLLEKLSARLPMV